METLTNYFDRIFNTDENGMGTNPNQRKIFLNKGITNAFFEISNKGKSMYIVLMHGSADDTVPAPFVAYK